MTDPTRFLDDTGASSAAVELLRALDPPKAASPAVRAALANQLTSLVAHGGAKVALGIGWLKASALALVVATAGGGALVWGSSVQVTPTSSALPARIAQLPSAAPGVDSGPAPPQVTESVPASEAPALRERAAPRETDSAKAAEPRDKLAEEEAILEQARQALRQDPSRALGLLRQHQNRFAGGQLAAERMYLSVDCLRRLGQLAAAQREADALIARYPTSAYARRAPQLLASSRRE